jgi:two-component system, response regulator PdtaR
MFSIPGPHPGRGEIPYFEESSMNAIRLAPTATEVEILRREVEKLTQKLAARRILERAKGILQAEFGWTEEEAYLHVRRLSRQNRIPMREIAINVIESREARAVGQAERRAS